MCCATDAQPTGGSGVGAGSIVSQAAWGDWKELHATRFPNNNLTTITQRISAAGFTPGLWMAPLTADLHSTLAAEHPDWILRQVRTVSQHGGLGLTSNCLHREILLVRGGGEGVARTPSV